MVKSLRNGKSDQRNTQGVAPTDATPWTCSKKRDLANESQVVIAAGSIRDGGAAVATPPLPALAVSVTCAVAALTPRTAVTAPAKTPFPYFICTCPPQACPSQKDAVFGRERLADECQVVIATARIGDGRAAIGRYADVRQVGDRPTVYANSPHGIADADRVASVATAVHVA